MNIQKKEFEPFDVLIVADNTFNKWYPLRGLEAGDIVLCSSSNHNDTAMAHVYVNQDNYKNDREETLACARFEKIGELL